MFTPPSSQAPHAGYLYWLSGLTCTDDNFCQKAAVAFKAAVKHNLILVMPDTSPRGAGCPGDKDDWDFGEGAGFYIDATTEHFRDHYRMYTYVTAELHAIVHGVAPPCRDKRSVFGHSMGGHGALVLYLKSGLYESCSAFAPIAHPSACPWGEKAFSRYLGDDRAAWAQWDATELVAAARPGRPLLVDQGGADGFLHKGQLLPGDLRAAASAAGVSVEYREHEGYDHSYFFITSFVEEHVAFHAKHLQ
jgi:S-formylglutathione hydrolase